MLVLLSRQGGIFSASWDPWARRSFSPFPVRPRGVRGGDMCYDALTPVFGESFALSLMTSDRDGGEPFRAALFSASLAAAAAAFSPQPLTSRCLCSKGSATNLLLACLGVSPGSPWTYLQGVLPAEALFAEGARVRLHRAVDPLVPLEVVVPVERLRADVAFERPFLRGRLAVVPVHAQVVPVRAVPAHGHARYQRQRPARVADVGHDRACHVRHLVVGVALPRRRRVPVPYRRRCHARH